MRVSAEGFLIVNFFMDFLILYLSSRGSWFLHIGRMLLASAAGAAYALADAMLALPLYCDILSFACLMLIAFPAGEIRRFTNAAVSVLAISLFMSAAVRAFLERSGATLLSGIVGCVFASAAVLFLRSENRSSGARREIQLRISYRGIMREFTAIVDTGNLLTEPLSGLPVLVADEKALGDEIVLLSKTDERGRMAQYGSVGGGGLLKCLRTDKMEILVKNRWVKAPDMWIGVYRGFIKSGVHALAPNCAYEK